MYPGAPLWLLFTLLATSYAADNPSVSWGDWIIVDETEPGSSILLRRITPKSVFVAPTFNGCSEGYRQDALGRCVKLVKVNQQAQWNFFLERLNSMYATSSTSKQPQKEAEPFHISLPIGSESSQEEVIVKKRVPPRDDIVQPFTTTTATPLPPVATTTISRVQESTLAPTQPTMVDSTVATSTFKEFNSETYSTTRRDGTTTESVYDVMLGDQPVTTEDFLEVDNLETPKNCKETTTQLPEKQFLIIVTNAPLTRTEETTLPSSCAPSTTEEGEGYSETPSTTEATTEGTTETTSRYTTDSTPRTTEYEENYSESRDVTETSVRPTERFYPMSTVRPKCDPLVIQVRDDSSDCEPAETATTPASLPATLPLLEPSTQVRFPSESFVPVRKTQSFVRFPETNPPQTRPSFWWPTWHVQQHPGVRGWPPSDDQHRQSSQSWSDSVAWHRRFFQRD